MSNNSNTSPNYHINQRIKRAKLFASTYDSKNINIMTSYEEETIPIKTYNKRKHTQKNINNNFKKIKIEKESTLLSENSNNKNNKHNKEKNNKEENNNNSEEMDIDLGFFTIDEINSINNNENEKIRLIQNFQYIQSLYIDSNFK